MNCKKCGAALPSHGYTCKFCGAMFDSEQIKKQKDFNKENKQEFELNFISDKYSKNEINREYKNNTKDNKILGAIIIILILVLLIIVGILKVL